MSPETDPLVTFAAWLKEAEATEPNDPNAMTLAATASHNAVTRPGRAAAKRAALVDLLVMLVI